MKKYFQDFDHTKKNRFLKQTNRDNIRKSIPLVESIQTDQEKHIKILELENNNLKKLYFISIFNFVLNFNKFNFKIFRAEDDQILAIELQQKYMSEIELDQLRRDEVKVNWI